METNESPYSTDLLSQMKKETEDLLLDLDADVLAKAKKSHDEIE
jgi:hypothetical protein